MNVSGGRRGNGSRSPHRRPERQEEGEDRGGSSEGRSSKKNLRVARKSFGSTGPLWNGCGQCMGTHWPSSFCHICAKNFSATRFSPPYSLPTSYRISRKRPFENSPLPSPTRAGLITRKPPTP